jgi:hypothetical protein
LRITKEERWRKERAIKISDREVGDEIKSFLLF